METYSKCCAKRRIFLKETSRVGQVSCVVTVENGHTVPAIETLQRFARALEVPMYQLFYDGEKPPKLPNLPKRKTGHEIAWGSAGKEAHALGKFRRLLAKTSDADKKILMSMAHKMAGTEHAK